MENVVVKQRQEEKDGPIVVTRAPYLEGCHNEERVLVLYCQYCDWSWQYRQNKLSNRKDILLDTRRRYVLKTTTRTDSSYFCDSPSGL